MVLMRLIKVLFVFCLGFDQSAENLDYSYDGSFHVGYKLHVPFQRWLCRSYA